MFKSISTIRFVNSSKCVVKALRGHPDSTMKKLKGKTESRLFIEKVVYLSLLSVPDHALSIQCSPILLSPNHLSLSQRLQMENTQFWLIDTCLRHMFKEHTAVKKGLTFFPHRSSIPILWISLFLMFWTLSVIV